MGFSYVVSIIKSLILLLYAPLLYLPKLRCAVQTATRFSRKASLVGHAYVVKCAIPSALSCTAHGFGVWVNWMTVK